MEETGLTPNTVTPKSNAWATWSLLLGIIGIPLCLLIIPELLAIIFGIVALVKISKRAGAQRQGHYRYHLRRYQYDSGSCYIGY